MGLYVCECVRGLGVGGLEWPLSFYLFLLHFWQYAAMLVLLGPTGKCVQHQSLCV